MRAMVKYTRLVLILSIPLVLLIGAVRMITSNAYLSFEYNKQSFPVDGYGFSVEERLSLAQAAMKFVRDPLPIGFLADQNFDGQPLYNERELDHMMYVQSVFQLAWWVGGIAILLTLGSAAWLLLAVDRRTWFARALELSGLGTAVAIFALGIVALLGWNAWFTTFHQLFFVPGTWVFEPSDTLIRLFPMQFWFDSTFTVFGLTLSGGLVTALSGYLLKVKAYKLGRRKAAKSMKSKSGKSRLRQEWPLSVYGWMFGLAFAGYFLGMIILGDTDHPLHWGAGAFGLVLGFWIGWAFVYWKEHKSGPAVRRS